MPFSRIKGSSLHKVVHPAGWDFDPVITLLVEVSTSLFYLVWLYHGDLWKRLSVDKLIQKDPNFSLISPSQSFCGWCLRKETGLKPLDLIASPA